MDNIKNQLLRNITTHYRKRGKTYLEESNKEVTCEVSKHVLNPQLKYNRKLHTAVSPGVQLRRERCGDMLGEAFRATVTGSAWHTALCSPTHGSRTGEERWGREHKSHENDGVQQEPYYCTVIPLPSKHITTPGVPRHSRAQWTKFLIKGWTPSLANKLCWKIGHLTFRKVRVS